MNFNLLFLTLNTFSGKGGLEKFNQAFFRSLSELRDQQARLVSLYDEDNKVIRNFKGFSGNRIRFILNTLYKSFNSRTIFVGHLNLAPIALLIKFFKPNAKVYLIIHGLEIWIPVSQIKRRLIQKADHFIVVSRHTKSSLMEQFGINDDVISILNNTIDPELVLPKEFSKPNEVLNDYPDLNNAFVLITVCRMKSSEGYKGYDKVIQSLSSLKQKIPNIKYVLIGKYDEEEKNRLDKLITNDIKGDVHFTGFVSDKELDNFFRFADVFVMPSTNEGFGIVYIESMAYGTPVVAGNEDGSTDALADGDLGFLINPNSQEELSNAILYVYSNYETILKGKELQGKVLDKFNFQNFKNRLNEILTIN